MATPMNHERMDAPMDGNGAQRSLATLTKVLARECEALARAEAELMKSEVNEKIAEAEKGIAGLIAGGALLWAGVLVLLFAAVFALDRYMQGWQAALLVGGVTALLGLLMLGTSKHKVSVDHLTPKRTLDEIRQGTGMAKEHGQ